MGAGTAVKNSMATEIQEYKSFEEEIRDTLETQYQMLMYNGDFESAYNTLGKLMAYKLIPVNDRRIEKNNKTYAKGGVSSDHRFLLDYRKTTSYIPEWLYGKLEVGRTVQLNSIEHMGKRVEGNYEGDTVFPSHPVDIRISMCNTTKQAENAFEGLNKILKADGKRGLSKDILDMCKLGIYRIYTMEVQSVCLNAYKIIGFVLIRMGEEDIQAVMTLNYDSMIGNWIDINETVHKIIDMLKRMTGAATFKTMIPGNTAIEKQAAVVKANLVKKQA